MSSTYLTSENMNMISRLLSETCEIGKISETGKLSARLLVRRFEKGTFNENRLRLILRRFLRQQSSLSASLDRWNDEGGLISTGATR